MEKRLYRDVHRKMIGGVCAGLADYFNIDVTIVRLVFLGLFFGHGAGFLMYIILLIALPKGSAYYSNADVRPGVDYRVPPFRPFNAPFPPVMPKKSSNLGMIFGVVLVVLGALCLIDQFDFIPDWDFEKVWPVILVAAGAAIIYSGQKKEPWEKEGWNKTVETEPTAAQQPTEAKPAFDLTKKTEEPNNDNPAI